MSSFSSYCYEEVSYKLELISAYVLYKFNNNIFFIFVTLFQANEYFSEELVVAPKGTNLLLELYEFGFSLNQQSTF